MQTTQLKERLESGSLAEIEEKTLEQKVLENLSNRSAAVQTAEGERDKRVFTDRVRVAEMFLLGETAREPKPKIRSRTDGKRLKSYRTVIARKAVNGVVLDPEWFSTTTSSHQRAVVRACRRADVPLIDVPIDVLRELDVSPGNIYILEGGQGRSVFHCDGKTFYRGNNGDDGRRWRNLGFVVELPRYAETVDQAEELLIPEKVMRAEANGLEITRQGEWFFIPREEAEPTGKLRKPLQESKTHESRANETGRLNRQYREPDLGNHVPRDKIREIPTKCPECNGTSFSYNETVDCKECGETVGPTVYVRGTVRHLDNDHRMVNLRETWHEAVTHGYPGISFDTGRNGRGMGAD